MQELQKIETSILKKYRKPIWNRFIGAIKDYQLIAQGDKIAVCISGGKDSMLLAKCMQMLQRHSYIPFALEYLVMDPGYRKENRELIQANAAMLHLPVHIFDAKIFDYVDKVDKSPCYLCARMRRGHLYQKAKELGCNKIALGHHFDDVIETTLLSMFYGAELKGMMPKLHSTNFEGMELIRPLYLVRETDIIAWKKYNGLTFLQCACRFTERSEAEISSKRQEIKNFIREYKKINPKIDINIFHSMHNVNLNTVIAYLQDGKRHSFLEQYDKAGD